MSRADSDQAGWERLASNLRVERALLDALQICQGFEVAVFKGGLLTRRLYGDLRQRASADNDLLVRTADGAAVLDRLTSHGYRALPGLDARRALIRTGQVALWPGGNLDAPSLDLHTEAFSRNFFSVAEESVWSRLETVELHGQRIKTFNAALSLAHLVAHFYQHLLDVSLLPDIARAWERFGASLPRQELLDVTRETCGMPALEYALGLCRHSVRAEMIPVPQTRRVRFLLQNYGPVWLSKRPRSAFRGFLSVCVCGPAQLPRALWRGFFPEGDELVSNYGVGSRFSLVIRHWGHRFFD